MARAGCACGAIGIGFGIGGARGVGSSVPAPDGGIAIGVVIGFGVGSSVPTENETNGMLSPMTQ